MTEEKAKKAVEEAIEAATSATADKEPDATNKADGKKRGRGKNAQSSSKALLATGIEGDVVVVDQRDQSVNLAGDDATIAGNAPVSLQEGAADLLGEINLTISRIYRSMRRKLPLDELGRLAAPRHAAILKACEHPEEFPDALNIMEKRLRRELSGKKDGDGNDA